MQRYPEIDLLRTIAILLMVIYHTAFDLSQFYGWDIDVFTGGWIWMARITATLFLVLVGVSAAIAYERSTWQRHIKRFLKIVSAALAVTIATYMVDPDTYVRFGILHVITVAALVVPTIASIVPSWSTIPIGIALIALGPWISAIRMDTAWLVPLGIRPHDFVSVDYFPMIPWLGVMLIGYGMGYAVYVRASIMRERRHTMASLQTIPTVMAWPGRHSLFLYLVHQPIIMIILWMILGQASI